jgi:hypothetical protein
MPSNDPTHLIVTASPSWTGWTGTQLSEGLQLGITTNSTTRILGPTDKVPITPELGALRELWGKFGGK